MEISAFKVNGWLLSNKKSCGFVASNNFSTKSSIKKLKHPAIDHAMRNMIYQYGVFSTTIKQINPIGVWGTSLPSKTGVSPKHNVWAPMISTEFL